MAIGAVILGLFAYGGYKRQQRQVAALAEKDVPRNVLPATAAGVDIAKDIPSGNLPNAPRTGGNPTDTGVLVPPDQGQSGPTVRNGAPSAAGPQVFVRQPAMRTQPVSAPIVQPREPTPEERRLQAAYEREQEAIAAPTTMREGFGSQGFSGSQGAATVRSNGDDGAQLAAALQNLTRHNSGSQLDANALRSLAARINPVSNGAEGGDQNMQDRKEVFLTKARAAQMEDYLNSTRTAPLSTFEIKAGWEIPAVLEQAMNSDLPGELKALVSSNVYDTATGRYLLIPQGARLIGVYNSRVGYGQDGVQVVWDRVIYPDGSSLDLSGMVGQDAHGASGFRDEVDRHYKRLIGFAVLTSMFAAASEIAQNQNRSLLTYPTRHRSRAARPASKRPISVHR